MSDIDSFREELQPLISKLEKDKNYYLSKGYLEAQVRLDFINPFFKALGWDIENKAQKPPHERDVIVELSPETTKRPDYNFRINGVTKFFVEAKSPSVALDDVNHILQAKSYAWSTKEVYFVVLTDFEEFRLYDASLKPNPKFPNEGLIFELKYTDYFDSIEKLWELSKERVEQGSLESLLPRDTKSKRLRIPPDKSFLEDLTIWRTELAKDIHKRNPQFDVKLLNDVVQKLLDRIIFIRIAEDRKIRPDRELWEIVAQWKEEGKRKSIVTHLIDLFHEVNDDLNGDIFKRHACETADVGSTLLADIIESLYFPESRYRFDAIGVELLGSIYERYLGSTIRVTPQRVKVEEKPEVRKAGGVYYTPKYIVDYIVKNTVGKIIEGKTPRQIEKIKILDPACGSGSFLLGAYQYLIDYHLKYYREHPKEAQTLHLFPYYKMSPEEFTLPIHEKAKILRNNIFGVDIDPQAVEITMMSLYLKALEGERGLLPKKQHLLPSLSNNIKCGNSLIGYDIFEPPSPHPSHKGRGNSNSPLPLEGGGLGRGWDDETKSHINPFDWNSKSAGFGEIMEHGRFDVVISNPPYLSATALNDIEKNYFKNTFNSAKGRLDTYGLFTEKSVSLLRSNGLVGLIVPNKFLTNLQFTVLREYVLSNCHIKSLAYPRKTVFDAAAVNNVVFILQKKNGIRKRNLISILEIDQSTQSEICVIDQSIYEKDKNHTFLLSYSERSKAIGNKIREKSVELQTICDVRDGIVAGRIKEFLFLDKKKNEFCKPLLFGDDMDRYSLIWKERYVDYRPDVMKKEERKRVEKNKGLGIRLRVPKIFETPKILTRKTADRIIATYDPEGYYFEQTVHGTICRSKQLNIKYILGIMNSKLYEYYYRNVIHQSGTIFPQVRIGYLKALPIRTIDFTNPSEKAIHDRLVSLVDKMLELHKKKNSLPPSAEREKIEREIAFTDEKIDEIVYELYGITEEERKIIEER